jgi:cytochrome c-type biogenesis protein CcmH/NrfG
LQGVCERWTEDQPGSAEAWRCLGLARHQAGAGRDALPALRQALKLEPNDAQVEAAILRILRP